MDASVSVVPDASLASSTADRTLTVIAVFQLADGGSESRLLQSGKTDLAPFSSATLSLPIVKDFRVRFFDSSDRIVPSKDTYFESDAGTLAYSVSFAEPLKSGRSYRLNIDAELSSSLVGSRGQNYEDFELEFKTSGIPVADPVVKKKHRRRR